MVVAVLVVTAYLCGSIPTGLWIGRWVGVDVRARGSGNIGATNVVRSAGIWAGLLTLAGDVGKGCAPVVVARVLLSDQSLVVLVGLAAFFGHIYSVFLNFSGGKGVATGFGVFAGLTPAPAMTCLIVFAAVAGASRYVSVASILAAAVLPLMVVACGYAWPTRVAASVVAVVIVVRHRENLSRLWRGTEPKFRSRALR
jgi:glycerol-3-phosphate acyltransferase PlsY